MEIQVGARIRELRAEKGLSQADLARELEVSPVTVYRWESGTREISLTMLGRVAKKLDTELSEFFPKAQASLFQPEEEQRRGEDDYEAPSRSREETAGAQTLGDLLAAAGIETRWFTKPKEEFDAWWRGVSREEAIQRFWQIEEEYRVIAAEWEAIHKGESTTRLSLRLREFFGQYFEALAAAPGREESPEEFYARQLQGQLRQFDYDKSPEETVARLEAA